MVVYKLQGCRWVEFKQTETFRKWRARLKDQRVRGLIASRLDRLAFGNAGDVRPVGQGISELRSTMAQATESTISAAETRSFFCCAAGTRGHRQTTSKRRSDLRKRGAKTRAERFTSYDPAEDLQSDEAIAVFMAQALETNDAAYVSHALGVVARAKGMTAIAERTGLSREQLYRSFSRQGNPTLKTTLAVMRALGIELTAKTTRRVAE